MAGRKVVSVALEAKVQGFISGMRSAKASVDDLTAAAAPNKQTAFDDLSNKAAVAGGAIAVGLGVAVKKFAEFDSAMSAVQANSGSTGAQLESLRQAAIDLGADTKFSATEAADGINELSKAGVSANDILGGGLKGSLDLAAAGQIGVGEAAETAATAMTQFNLNGSEIPHVADLLTNAANKAQGGVGDLAEALKQGGLVAASTGLTIDETTASLAAFASAGLTGSDAGTSLKTMLQRLSAPSGEAAALMEKLGISAYDASGEFVGMEALAGQLQTGLSGLTAEQRNSALATIFGSDAVRAANILYAEGANGISKWTTEVTEQGAAAKQAAILNDNLKGDIERLGGALDSAFIKTGSGANGALRTLVQGLTGVVDSVGSIPGPVLLAGGALTSLALVGPKVVSSFRGLKAEAAAVGLSMDNIASRGPRAAEAMHGLDRGARAAAKGFAVLSAAKVAAETLQSDELAVGVEKATERVLGANDAVAEMNKILEENAVKSFEADSTIRSLGDAADVAFNPSKMESFSKGNEAVWKGLTLGLVDVTTKTDEANDAFSQIDAQLAGLVQGGNADAANSLFQQYADEVAKSGVSTDEFKTKLPGFTEALAAAGNQSKLAGDGMAGMGDDAATAEQAVSDLSDAVRGLGDTLLQQEASQDAYEASLDSMAESIKENGRTLDASTEAGRANRAALRDLANETQEWAAATLEAGGSTEKVQGILDRGRAKWIANRDALGANKTETRALANELFKIDGLDATAKVDAKTEGAKKKADDFKRVITGMDGQKASVSVQEKGAGESKARVLSFNTTIRDLSGKTVTVTEEGADVSQVRVRQLDGALLGLPGHKKVQVTEVGSTAAGEMVVEFKNKVYAIPASRTAQIRQEGADQAKSRVLGLNESIRLLNGKTVKVGEDGAQNATGRVRTLDGTIFGLKGKTVSVQEIGATASGDRVVNLNGKIYALSGKTVDAKANVYGQPQVDGLRNSIGAMSDKTVTVTTVINRINRAMPFADGGVLDRPAIGSQAPQIRAAGGRGITWAEDGAGPWEAFISGHPNKRRRSRAIAAETVDRLGGQILWDAQSGLREAFASGGIYSRWRAQLRNVRALSNRYRWEDGSRQIQVFEDGTARWAGYGSAPAAVAQAIASLNAAQDAYESGLNAPQQRQRRPWQHSQEFYDARSRWASAPERQWQHSAEYTRKQAQWARERKAGSSVWQHSEEYKRKQAEWKAARNRGAFMRSTPSAHEGRTYVSPSTRGSWSSGSAGVGHASVGITEAGMERAITSAFSRVKVVTNINGRAFAGVIQRTTADRKGR